MSCMALFHPACVFSFVLLPSEKSQSSKVKEFYTEHASAIFYVFYSSFSILETAIHEKCELAVVLHSIIIPTALFRTTF